MSKKFNMDCAAERIVNKIYLKYREYIVDEFIKIDWSFFEDGDKEKILTDEDFFGLICEMLYEKMDYYDCYARDDYFYILRLDDPLHQARPRDRTSSPRAGAGSSGAGPWPAGRGDARTSAEPRTGGSLKGDPCSQVSPSCAKCEQDRPEEPN